MGTVSGLFWGVPPRGKGKGKSEKGMGKKGKGKGSALAQEGVRDSTAMLLFKVLPLPLFQ